MHQTSNGGYELREYDMSQIRIDAFSFVDDSATRAKRLLSRGLLYRIASEHRESQQAGQMERDALFSLGSVVTMMRKSLSKRA